ncbi:hypothetical protein SLEP1_g1370 [Rubroshorea leprosula]|uniref:Uncharacterized protein n=1 Tax=Rubroshorea leprosula TaxID=152421 RepID=A0AAV5HLW0_9ROSI|nr:hypothetical protein SLEP1_g1370 [Rubroshorea leprosula]
MKSTKSPWLTLARTSGSWLRMDLSSGSQPRFIPELVHVV